MTVVNYVTLPQGYPIGFGIPESAVLTLYLPSIALFNATVVLYTVPLGEFISDVVKSRTRFKT